MGGLKRVISFFIPNFVFSFYHWILAWLGNMIYSSPSKKLRLIGVTGTKGKTTTSYFIHQILNRNKKKTAVSSTTFLGIGNKVKPNYTKMGMPGRFFLPRFLKNTAKENTEYAVIETTSEGILQHRHRFLHYQTVVFTGLAPEHLEHHGGLTSYRKTKEKLFKKCKGTHILNLDDNHVKYFLQYEAKEKWGIMLDPSDTIEKRLKDLSKETSGKLPSHIIEGRMSSSSKVQIQEIEILDGKIKVIKSTVLDFPFTGDFNLSNLLLSIASVRSLGIPFPDIISSIPKLSLPPGRMEEVKIPSINYRIFIDYAHEPLSLKSALNTGRKLVKRGKLICLTGAQGGGRDKWKRKVMGRIAAEFSDYVIVSIEDPYKEGVEKINKDVLEGVLSSAKFEKDKNCWEFKDRPQAIRRAVSLAKKGDLILFAGKGGENKMCIGDTYIPWNEKEEVRKAVRNQG